MAFKISLTYLQQYNYMVLHCDYDSLQTANEIPLFTITEPVRVSILTVQELVYSDNSVRFIIGSD